MASPLRDAKIRIVNESLWNSLIQPGALKVLCVSQHETDAFLANPFTYERGTVKHLSKLSLGEVAYTPNPYNSEPELIATYHDTSD